MSIFSDFANSINDVVDAQNNRVQKTQKERNDPKVQYDCLFYPCSVVYICMPAKTLTDFRALTII